MRHSIGIDTVSVKRLTEILQAFPSFTKLAFTRYEKNLNNRQLAGNFAAKEALVKATSGLINLYDFRYIAVKREANGSPFYALDNNLLEQVGPVFQSRLTISYCGGYVTAAAIVEFTSLKQSTESKSDKLL